jgi:uncharacterized membrane protein
MSPWGVILAVAVVSAAIKAAGPVVLQDRTFPPRTAAVIDALAPALLAGLIVVELLGRAWEGADATVVPGLVLGAALRFAKVPDAICVAAAVAATVLVRLVAS